MYKVYHVKLDEGERSRLIEIVQKGNHAARKVRRAHTLLLADEGQTDEQIVQTLKTSLSTVGRTRKQLVEEGLEAALSEGPRSGCPMRLDAKGEAFLVATACSAPPEGRDRWTLELLRDRVVESEITEGIAKETIRQMLKKRDQAVAKEAVAPLQNR